MPDSGHNTILHQKYLVLRSFLGQVLADSQRLVQEVLDCHEKNSRHSPTDNAFNAEQLRDLVATSTASIPLNLGIPCGGHLDTILPHAVSVARRAYQCAAAAAALEILPSCDAAAAAKSNSTAPQELHDALMAIAQGPLSGLSLLYGTKAAMSPHYDSPTQYQQRAEWLVLITLGNTVDFRCHDQVIPLQSGDVLVMDSMAVLHGVERIHVDTACPTLSHQLQLPGDQVRLGILFWQGRSDRPAQIWSTASPEEEQLVDGICGLFNIEE
jgi:hypothetical protein